MIRNFIAMCTGMLLLGAPAATAIAGPVDREHKQIELTGESAVEATVDFGAGTIELAAAPDLLLLDAEAVYDSKRVDFYVDYAKQGSRGRLALKSDLFGSHVSGNIRNDWRIGLTGTIPLELVMDIGAAEADMDLSGLRLTGLDLDIGAAEADIRWDEPNTEALRKISIDCGASSLTLTGLGNANFEYLNFDGGLGSFELDFSGAWTRSAEADLDIGMGSLRLEIPERIGVRIETEGSFLSSVDVDRHFERVDDDVYESANYRDADVRFDVRIKLGMGSVDVRATRR